MPSPTPFVVKNGSKTRLEHVGRRSRSRRPRRAPRRRRRTRAVWTRIEPARPDRLGRVREQVEEHLLHVAGRGPHVGHVADRIRSRRAEGGSCGRAMRSAESSSAIHVDEGALLARVGEALHVVDDQLHALDALETLVDQLLAVADPLGGLGLALPLRQLEPVVAQRGEVRATKAIGLLISWAMPAASSPTAARRPAVTRRLRRSATSRMSCEHEHAAEREPLLVAQQARRRRDRDRPAARSSRARTPQTAPSPAPSRPRPRSRSAERDALELAVARAPGAAPAPGWRCGRDRRGSAARRRRGSCRGSPGRRRSARAASSRGGGRSRRSSRRGRRTTTVARCDHLDAAGAGAARRSRSRRRAAPSTPSGDPAELRALAGRGRAAERLGGRAEPDEEAPDREGVEERVGGAELVAPAPRRAHRALVDPVGREDHPREEGREAVEPGQRAPRAARRAAGRPRAGRRGRAGRGRPSRGTRGARGGARPAASRAVFQSTSQSAQNAAPATSRQARRFRRLRGSWAPGPPPRARSRPSPRRAGSGGSRFTGFPRGAPSAACAA